MNQEGYNISFWVDIAQIATMILTLGGICLSFWMSRKALMEVQHDRVISQRPFLLFEYGGHQENLEFKKLSDGNELISIYWPKVNNTGGIHVPTIGKLKNLGTGPAISIKLKWVLEEIIINGNTIKLDKSKRKEKRFSPAWNENPIMTSHLLPNKESGYHLLPYFISNDFKKEITEAHGFLVISYHDTFNNKHKTYQKFHAFVDYKKQTFHTTFSNLMKSKSSY